MTTRYTTNNFIFFWIISICFFFTSCASQRVVKQNNAHQLSKRFGFTVTQKDDLKLFNEVNGWLGVPYRHGGSTKQGTDCSGFVMSVYKNVYNKNLQRSCNLIYQKNCERKGKNNLKTGDLVFFNFNKKGKGYSHVGIHLKKGYFAHASSSRGVMINHISEKYYKNGYKRAGRVK